VAVLSRVETVTLGDIIVYLSLGPVLVVGLVVAARSGRMPGLVLLGVILWTSMLGTVSSFYYDMTPITTVALCTAFVSWLGSRVAPLYAVSLLAGLVCAGLLQQDPAVLERTIVVGLATVFAVSIVGRSSDSSRTAHHDREVLLERLGHESRCDELTGIGNRKHLIEQTMVAIDSGAASTVALALIDLDAFKAINDTHGHAVGDAVLTAVASRLAASASEHDVVVRIGGDEFAVLFGDGDIGHDDAARLLGEVCRDDLIVDGIAVPIRASIGVAVRDRRTTSLEELLADADVEMYAQKRLRRLADVGSLIL